MTATEAKEKLLEDCEGIINLVIKKTRLDRSFFGDREEAKQFLRLIILEDIEIFRRAPMRLRWVILYRRAVDMRRKHQIVNRRSSDVPSVRFSDDASWMERLPLNASERRPSPEQDAAAHEILLLIHRSMSEMPPHWQKVLLDYLDGISSERTGKKLGVSGSRVRQIFTDVITDIRKKL